MASLDLGALRTELVLDASQYHKELNNSKSNLNGFADDVDKNISGIKTKIGDGIGKAAKTAGLALGALALAGVAALGALAAKGIDLASDLNEVENVVNVAFGDNAQKIKDWASSASNAFGLSKLEAENMTGSMGAMLKSMGLTADQTVTMSEGLAGLAGDFSSFYNLEHDEAWEKIRAGIAGEAEPLKSLGINMSVANMEAYALAEGISKPYAKMNQSEQTLLRYNYLMKVSADAQGDFARTSSGWANQTRIAQMNIENLASGLGTKLLPSLTGVLQEFNKVAQESGGDASKFISNMGSIVDAGMAAVEEILPIITSLATDIINGLITILPKLLDLGGQMIIQLVIGITDMLPQIAAAAGTIVGKLAAGIVTHLPEIVGSFLQAVPLIIEGFITGLLGLEPVYGKMVEESKKFREEVDNLRDSVEKSKQAFEDNVAEINTNSTVANKLADELYNLADKENKSNAEKAKMKSLVTQLNQLIPNLNLKLDEQTGKLNLQKKAISDIIAAKKQEILLQAYEERLIELYKEKVSLEEKYTEATNKATEASKNLGQQAIEAMIPFNTPTYVKAAEDMNNLKTSIDDNTASITALEGKYTEASATMITASTASKDAVVTNEQATTAETAEEQAARQKAQEEYAQKLESTTKEHVDSMGSIYDKEIKTHKETIDEVKKNLQTQVKQFESWQSNIQKLAKRVPSDVLVELEKLGPESAPLIKSLVKASDADLAEFVKVWQSKGTAAKNAAISELGGTTNEVDTLVSNIGTSLNNTSSIETNAKALGKSIDTKIKEGINDSKESVVNAANNIGGAIIDGMKNGMSGKLPSLLSKARSIANSVLSEIKKTYGIASPSKVFASIGQYMAEGLNLGFSNQMAKVTSNMNKLMPVPTFDANVTLGYRASTQQNAAIATANKSVTQNNYFTSRQLSPYEQQLQIRRLNRDLAGAIG